MKTIIVLFAILGEVLSAPSGGYVQYATAPSGPAYYPQQIPVKTEKVNGPIITGTLYQSQDTYGQYKYGYSSSDGQNKEETRNNDGEVEGKFAYISPEGQKIVLAYEADKDGFQATGDHLPVAPEVPELPEELAAAYKISNDQLAQAYEEARLRGDDENSDDGSYKPDKYEDGYAKEPASGSYGQIYQVPTYQVPAVPASSASYVIKEIKVPVVQQTSGVYKVKTTQSNEAPKTNYAYRRINY